MKEKICMAIIHICMVVAIPTLGFASFIYFRDFHVIGDVYGVLNCVKNLFGGFFFGASCIAVIWCFVGMVRA